MWYGLIVTAGLVTLLLMVIIRGRYTSDLTDRILRNELKRRSSIRNKHRNMKIEGKTVINNDR